MESVPSYPEVGQNSTVKVLVNNNSDEPIPVYFRVEAPINVMVVLPIYVEAVVPPNGQVVGNFTVLAFNTSYRGLINVSAVLYIWFYDQMSRPQEVQVASAVVYRVNPSPYSQEVQALFALLIIVPVGLGAVFYIKSKRHQVNHSLGP